MIVNRELQRIFKVLRYPVLVTKFTELGVKVVMPATTDERAGIATDSRKSYSIMLDETVMINVRVSSLPINEMARPEQIVHVSR
jgi:uncharacterized membrane protein